MRVKHTKEKNELAKQIFFSLLDSAGLERPITEHAFHTTRKWRFDYCWPQHMIALEVEGGIFTNGRHSRGAGMKEDFNKYNEAAIMGWRIIKVVPTELNSMNTIKMLRRILLF